MLQLVRRGVVCVTASMRQILELAIEGRIRLLLVGVALSASIVFLRHVDVVEADVSWRRQRWWWSI